MRSFAALATVLAVAVSGVSAHHKIVLSNDDGWATCNIRAAYKQLTKAGYDVILSAPAEGRSGSGSLELPAVPVLLGCQFDTCAPLSDAEGHNNSDSRINYYNSFPASAARHGIEVLAPRIWKGAKPDLVVAGPNIGNNLGLINEISGTIGAAAVGARKGIPSFAFSGASGNQIGFKHLPTQWSDVYATLQVKFLQEMTKKAPFAPKNAIVSVNFPSVSMGCTNPKFVLARVNPATIFNSKDISQCGTDRLPTESHVVEAGCYASVSVLDADTKLTAQRDAYKVVKDKLGKMLTCLPK